MCFYWVIPIVILSWLVKWWYSVGCRSNDPFPFLWTRTQKKNRSTAGLISRKTHVWFWPLLEASSMMCYLDCHYQLGRRKGPHSNTLCSNGCFLFFIFFRRLPSCHSSAHTLTWTPNAGSLGFTMSSIRIWSEMPSVWGTHCCRIGTPCSTTPLRPARP